MSRVCFWVAFTLVFGIVCAVALVHEPHTESRTPPALEVASTTFAIGGVHLPGEDSVVPTGRDPFVFARLHIEPKQEAEWDRGKTGFPILTLDGVLLRKGEEKAFFRIGGRPFVAGRGELVDARVRVESIDQDGVVVRNQSGERRRLHLADQASDRN